MCESSVDQWMEYIYDENTERSPDQRKQKAHISIQIERHIRIIPPFVMENLFENEPGQPFDCSNKSSTSEI